MAKKKNKTDETDSNSWITTFTNLMILLLAFFIVLVNLAVIDNQKKQIALNSLLGSFGFHMGGQSPIGKDSGSDITMADSPMVKGEVSWEQLQNIVISNGLESDVMISRGPEKTVITLSDRVLFEKGSYEIPQGGIEFLADLSTFFKDEAGLIELRGYTDQSEIATDQDPLRTSIYLSTKRALAVLHFFLDNSEIPITRMIAHGFGIAPKGDQRIKEKRDWDRQVEIIVNNKEKIPYRLRVLKEEDHVLDFKGFLFKPSRPRKDQHGSEIKR